MNKIHRNVWNESLGSWVAVAETSKSKRKGGRAAAAVALVGLVGALLFPGAASAQTTYINASGDLYSQDGQTYLGSTPTFFGFGSISFGSYDTGRYNGYSYNTFMGYDSGINSFGGQNSAFGWNAGNYVNGFENSVFGTNAGVTVNGSGNSAFGSNSGSNVVGESNTAVGRNSGIGVQGSNNAAIGNYATNGSVGEQNVGVGFNSGSNTNGNSNVAIGSNAGVNTVGGDNIAIGSSAGQGTQNSGHVSIGAISGINVQGADTVNIGTAAGFGSSGNHSNSVGYYAGYQHSGNENSFYGTRAGFNAAGDFNVGVGVESLIGANGQQNVAVGTSALYGSNGNGNVGVGNNANTNTFLNGAPISNATALGQFARVDADGGVALGSNSIAGAGNTSFATTTLRGVAMVSNAPQAVGYGVVSVGQGGIRRQVTNVADGDVSINSTDAVNGSQLFQVANLIGASANAVEYTDGTKTAISLAGVGGTTVSGVRAGSTAVGSTDAVNGEQLGATNTTVAAQGTRLTTAEGTIASQGTRLSTAEGTIATQGTRLTTAEGAIAGNTAAIGVLSGNVSGVAADLGALTTTVTALDAGIANGSVGLVRQTGGAPSNGAITVGANTGGNVVNVSGTDGARVLSGVAAGIAATDAVNMGQLVAVAGASVNAMQYDDSTKARATLGGVSGTVIANVADGAVNATSKEAVNGSQLNTVKVAGDNNAAAIGTLSTSITNGTVGLVQQTGGPGNGALRIGDATGGTVLSVAGTQGNRVVSGVANGSTAVGSKDAVNGGQLQAVGASTASALGGGASYNQTTGTLNGPTYTVNGTTYDNVGAALAAVSADGGSIVVNNASSRAAPVATGQDSVAIGAGSNASRPNTADFGGRALTGLADGVAPSDAATVGQVNRSIESVRKDAHAAGALGSALAQASIGNARSESQTQMNMAVATIQSQPATAIGVTHFTKDNRWRFAASVGVARGVTGAAVSASFGF